jgi:hypothetical protein
MNPSAVIDQYIAELGDWRGPLSARLRTLIRAADPDITEEWKWNSPVWSDHGMVVSLGVFKDHLKLNFFQGASISDPHGLFNAGLEAKASRAIDFRAGDAVDEAAVQDLVRAAVAHNCASH